MPNSKLPSRAFLNASIAGLKSKIAFRQGRLKHYTRVKKNALQGKSRYSFAEASALKAKWSKRVYEAQNQLAFRRAQLQEYRDADLKVTKMDLAGRNFLRQEEGERLVPYNDSEGHATIGVGHLIHYGNVTQADRDRYRNFSKKDSDELFQKDLLKYEAAVLEVFEHARLKLTQNRFNACVSLCFNIGTGGFLNSTVAKEIQKGNSFAAADAFLLWKKPAVLLPRRQRERALFLKD